VAHAGCLFQGCARKIRYDPQVNAAYISFKKGPVQVTTIRINEDIALDFGPNEEIVGIEILDASENLEWVSREPRSLSENYG